MQINLLLSRPREAERLRTAVYRFSELKKANPPAVELRADEDRILGAVSFWSPEAAREFQGYWRTFQSERPATGGFLDV